MNKVKLTEIAVIRTGYPFRAKVERDPKGTIAVIQMKDIDAYNRLDLSDVYKVRIKDLNQQYLLQRNDILFRSRGVSNTAALVTEAMKSSLASAPLMVIRIKSRKVEPAYVAWYLNHPYGQHQISRLSEGTSLLMVNKLALEQLEIDLPPLDTQTTIAEIAALDQREQQIMDQLTQKRRAYIGAVLMQQAQA